MDISYQRLPCWVGEEIGAAGANLIGDAHILGMVGDGDPVQRSVLFEALAVIHDDFPACGNSEEVVGGQRYPKHSRVEGEAGVDVSDAPVNAIRVGLADVGGVLPAADDRSRRWLCRFLWRSRSGYNADEFGFVRIGHASEERTLAHKSQLYRR